MKLLVVICLAIMPFFQSSGGKKTSAVVKDMSGIDGCGIQFVLPDKNILQPVNMEDWQKIILKEGDKVILSYQEEPGRSSTCMSGRIVKITYLEKQPKAPVTVKRKYSGS